MKPSILLANAILLASLICFLLLDLSYARSLAFEEGCGTDHLNQSCGYPYPCCSIHGHCGDTVYFCAPGNCLPEFGTCWDNVPPPPPPSTPSPEASLEPPDYGCGEHHHNQSCGDPYPCCSTYGNCGNTTLFCAPGNCQPEFGKCWDNAPPPPPPSPPSPEAPSPAPSPEPVDYGCGEDHHNHSCGDAYPYPTAYPCCSTSGWCGNTAEYCAPGNCLPEFGTCWDNVPPPPPEIDQDSEDSLIRNVFTKLEMLNQF